MTLLVTDFETLLASATLPAGFSAEEWRALKEEAGPRAIEAREQAATDPDKALATYRLAFVGYLRAAATKLHHEGQQCRQRIEGKNYNDSAAKAADLAKVDAVIKAAKQALDHLDKTEVSAACDQYRVAVAAFQALTPEMKGEAIGRLMSGGSAAARTLLPVATGVLAGWLPEIPVFGQAPAVPTHLPRALMTLAQLQSTRWLLDKVLWLLLLAIAVATGLQLLWANDPTWGGWTACLTALLWGLGLHQVSGSAFEGTAGLLGRIAK